MNRAQRWLVLVVCVLVAGVFSWGWYLGPLHRWTVWRDGIVHGGLAGFTSRMMRTPLYPDRPENLTLGIALPLVLAGLGLFVLFGKRKGRAGS